jgi:hypothetical protein
VSSEMVNNAGHATSVLVRDRGGSGPPRSGLM